MVKDNNYFKTIALERLAFFGNKSPSIKQINEMVYLLENVGMVRSLTLDARLTKREKDCLYYTAIGKNTCEIAALLKVKKVTVKAHRQGIKRKLCAKSMGHAVFLGTRFGCINLAEKV